MQGNTRRKLKKEYIPLMIALLVLVVLVLTLLLVIFYDDKKGLIVPDLPDKEVVNVGVFDFDSGKYDSSKLDLKDTKKSKIDYKVISDYYTNGIIISNPYVTYDGENFIVRGGQYAADPYVSVIDKNGKLMWLSKVSTKGYDYVKVVDVIKKHNKYHVFAIATKDEQQDNIVIRLNEKGNEEKREVISENTKNSIKSVASTDLGFVVMTDGKDNIEIYYISDNYKMVKNPLILRESKSNIFKTYTPYILSSLVSNDTLTIVIGYPTVNDDTMFLLNYDLNNGNVAINKFSQLNNISHVYTNMMYSTNNSFYTVDNDNIVYQFSKTGELLNKYDYNNIKLGNIAGCVQENEEPGACEDKVSIGKYITNSDGTFMVEGLTKSDNYLYDVFDSNLKLKKRYFYNLSIQDDTQGTLLTSIYIDNKLYGFYVYGIDTPSIMVSIIG